VQKLQIESGTHKFIVKTMMIQEGNFELTSQMIVGHVNLSLAKIQVTIFRISEGNCV
jgi:hypothetical protein